MPKSGANWQRPNRFQARKQQQTFAAEKAGQGNKVRADQIQNNHVADMSRSRVFHAHQQPHNIVSAKKPPTERPNNSCIRRIAQTSWVCCGTTKQAQIKAIPAKKLAALKNPNLGAILVAGAQVGA